MQGSSSSWQSAIVISCSIVVALIAVVWTIRKNSSSSTPTSDRSKKKKVMDTSTSNRSNRHSNDQEKNDGETSASSTRDEEDRGAEDIAHLPGPNWMKVGSVKELYYYPLKSGRGKEIDTCTFTEYGISVKNEGRLNLRDRMFLVYNENTGRFQTGRKYPTLLLVSLSAVDECKVKLEAVGMPSVVFDAPRPGKSTEVIECTMWWGEPLKCIDCGSKVAEWLSRFLTGTYSGLRLACFLTEGRCLQKSPWERFMKEYKTLRSEDAGLFSDVTSYMLMTSQSLDKLNESSKNPVPIVQFRPNIIVSGEEAFEEDTWEWIKIGSRAVIRNVKPCLRIRKQDDSERASVDGNPPILGVYCGLYVTGPVKIGDDVFVHVPNLNSVKLNGTHESDSIHNDALTNDNQTN